MNKQKIIQNIQAAKRAHISWVMKADALIHGIPLEKDQVPVNGTECIFGKWYYGEAQIFNKLPEFKAIEQPRFDLHSTYARIFKLLYESDEGSFLSKLFGKSQKLKESNLKEARNIFPELKAHSEIVVKRLENLEQAVQKKIT
jgi:hypothetical protein